MNKTQGLFRSINKLNDIVKITIGPNSRNLIINCDNGSPLITNNGVKLLKKIYIKLLITTGVIISNAI